MSETQTQPTPEYVPQDVLSAEDNEDATQPLQQPQERSQDAPEAKDEAKEEIDAEERLRRQQRREAARIGQITKQRYAEKARADEAERRLAEYEQRLRQVENPGAAPQQPTQQDVERWVDQRAEQKLAIQQHTERVNAWDKEGGESFGTEKFRDACKTLAEMASDEQRQTLLNVAMDIDGSQKALVELADNPEEAERILALPAHRMALAIAKLGATETLAPKRVSSVPPPIRPPSGGRARGEPDPEHGDMDTYMRWSSKQSWRR
jgi:hypothetical protein